MSHVVCRHLQPSDPKMQSARATRPGSILRVAGPDPCNVNPGPCHVPGCCPWHGSGRGAAGRGAECGRRAGQCPSQGPFPKPSIGDGGNGVMGLVQAAGVGSFPPTEGSFSFQDSETFQAQFFWALRALTPPWVSHWRHTSTLATPPQHAVGSCCLGLYIPACFCCYVNCSVSIIHRCSNEAANG